MISITYLLIGIIIQAYCYSHAHASELLLEKRGYQEISTIYASTPTANVVSTVATDAFTCSLSTFNHGYPSAHVSYAPEVKKLDNGLYEATMYFDGDNCSDFDGASEIKLDGVQPNVVLWSHNNPANKGIDSVNGCHWVAPFSFQASYDSQNNRWCMNGGSQIQYD